MRKVYFDPATRVQKNDGLPTGFSGWDYIYGLTCAQFGTKIVLMSTFYYDNKSGGFLGTGLFSKRRRYAGGVALDAGVGNAKMPLQSFRPPEDPTVFWDSGAPLTRKIRPGEISDSLGKPLTD